MSAPTPILSLVVVCRNPGVRLHAALASVWAQQGVTPELIVIDGASTDGTHEWLETERGRLAALVSEPDAGIYAAMNKGLARATGRWVLFLGADDVLADATTLARCAVALAPLEADVAVGEVVYDDGRRYAFAGPQAAVRRNFVHHQAAFHRRATFARLGAFDASLRIMGDYDLNLRWLRQGAEFAVLPLRVATCGVGGASDAGHWLGYREEIRVRHRHFPAWRCWLWDAGSVVRHLRKRLVGSRR